jgi:hypothetical protein
MLFLMNIERRSPKEKVKNDPSKEDEFMKEHSGWKLQSILLYIGELL